MNNDISEDKQEMIEKVEKAYKTSEVATMLGLAVPTIRKYSQILESKGYNFLHGEATGQHKARLFLDKDIMVLRYLSDIRKKSNMKVEQAASVVVERFGKGDIQSVSPSDIRYNEDYNRRYMELKHLVEHQSELIESLIDKMEEQQEYINKRLEERDSILMESIDKVLKPQKKQGLFARLFSKTEDE